MNARDKAGTVHYIFAALMGVALGVCGVGLTDWRWWVLFLLALAWSSATARRASALAALEGSK